MLHSLIHTGLTLQRTLYEGMAGAVHDYRDSPGAGLILWLYGLSFTYGVLHAVGPGHGKIAISSYLMASGSKLRRGLWITLISSLAQAVSAVAVVGVLALILHLTSRRIDAEVSVFETVSYGLITLFGVWMLILALRGGHHHHHEQDHGHDHHGHAHHGHAHEPAVRKTTLTAVILAVGLRPCSGAVLVLLFTLGQGIFGLGIGAAFVMSLGTAATVTTLAIFAVLARQSAMRVIKIDSPLVAVAERAFAIAGALFIIVGGGLFLLAALQPASSL